jgi:superfamily I DNA/RNA helicase
MSLKFVNITAKRRLNLMGGLTAPAIFIEDIGSNEDTRLPAPEVIPLNLSKNKELGATFLPEEILYSEALLEYPQIGILVESLGLVSATTGQALRIAPAKTSTAIKPQIRLEAHRAYQKSEILDLLAAESRLSDKVAEIEFMRLLEEGVIEQSYSPGLYQLTVEDIF